MKHLDQDGATLWKNGDFLKFWSAQTISFFGSVVTRDALPMAAILVLSASPIEISVLMAASAIAPLTVGFLAGVWVDRVRRKPILITCDIAQAFLLFTIPVAFYLGSLTILHLVLIAFLAGCFAVVSKVADQSLLPTILKKEDLLEGNSKLEMSGAISEVGGASIAGILVQLFTAPMAILVDAFSFLFSAATLATIKKKESLIRTGRKNINSSIWRDFKLGVSTVWERVQLRHMLLVQMTLAFFLGIVGAIYYLFALKEAGLNPMLLGLLVGSGGIGSLIGATVVKSVRDRLGFIRSVSFGIALNAAFIICLSMAQGALLLIVAIFLGQQIIGDAAQTSVNINLTTKLQTDSPAEFLGRISSIFNVLPSTAGLLGLFAGGLCGEFFGLRATLVVAGAGNLAAAVLAYHLFSRIGKR